MLVQMKWNVNDDFDLYLLQPNGEEVSRSNRETAAGAQFEKDSCIGDECAEGAEKVEAVTYALDAPGIGAGTRYKFRIDDELDVPDPGSDFQPEDVSGPSELIDHCAYVWRAKGGHWSELRFVAVRRDG